MVTFSTFTSSSLLIFLFGHPEDGISPFFSKRQTKNISHGAETQNDS